VLLYHWTLKKRAEEILADGFKASDYQSVPGMVRGVWFSEDPLEQSLTNDARIEINFPDEMLEAAWRPGDSATDWQIPPEQLTGVEMHIYIPTIYELIEMRAEAASSTSSTAWADGPRGQTPGVTS
jgi:hypothetical protein